MASTNWYHQYLGLCAWRDCAGHLDAYLRRLILPTASMAVFGVNLAVPTARVPDDKMAQLIAQEDASRRPFSKKVKLDSF